MDLIPLNHSVSSISTQNSVLDTYLLQRDLPECLHDIVQLSRLGNKNKNKIKSENAKRTIDTTSRRHVWLLADTLVYRQYKTLTHQRQYK